MTAVCMSLAIGVVLASSTLGASAATASRRSSDHSTAQAVASGKYGSFVFNGPIVGTLRPLATTCGASKATTSVEFIWFGNTPGLKGVPPKSNIAMEIDLGDTGYGRAGRFRNVVGRPPYLAFSAEGIGTKDISWRSLSGSYRTAKKGASGSIDVTMAPTGTTKGGRLTIRGSWRNCA